MASDFGVLPGVGRGGAAMSSAEMEAIELAFLRALIGAGKELGLAAGDHGMVRTTNEEDACHIEGDSSLKQKSTSGLKSNLQRKRTCWESLAYQHFEKIYYTDFVRLFH